MSHIDAGLRREGTTVYQRAAADALVLGSIPSALPANTKLALFAGAATQVPLRLRLAAAHSAQAATIESSAGAVLSAFRETGALVLGGGTLAGSEILRAVGASRMEGNLDQLSGVLTLAPTSGSIISTAALTLTAGAASTWSTSAGALSITSAAAATWRSASGNLTINGAASLLLQGGGTTVASIDGTNLSIAANKNIVGAAGTGALTLGSMTGDSTLPTGALSWMGAAGKAGAFVASGASITITAGASSTWSSVGSLFVNGGTTLALQVASTDVLSLSAALVTIPSGVDFLAAGGVTAFSFGASSGGFTFPTGDLSWTGAATRAITFVGQAAITFTAGAASTWSTSAGALTLDGGGGLNLAAGAAVAAAIPPGGGELQLQAGKNLTAAAGASAFSWGSATGDFTFPTGAVSWTGASGKALSFVSTAAAITFTAGAASTWKTSTGDLDVDAASRCSLGRVTATSVEIGKSGIQTTINGNLVGVNGRFTTDFAIPGTSRQAANLNLTTQAVANTDMVVPLAVGFHTFTAVLTWVTGATNRGFGMDLNAEGGLVVANVRRTMDTVNHTDNAFTDSQTATNITTDLRVAGAASKTYTSTVTVHLEVTTAGSLRVRAGRESATAGGDDTVLQAASHVWSLRFS